MPSEKFNIYKANNLCTLDFIDHAFFGRNGGYSTKEDFSSLNVSYFTKDDPLKVAKNRNLVSNFWGKNNTLITLNQQSTNKVIVVKNNLLPHYTIKGDALITQHSNIILGIYTADCVPILLADPITKTIAAIHAGHSGAYLGIVEETINVLKSMEVKPSNLIAALGPSIKQESYEVQSDFYMKLLAQNKNNSQFFIYTENKKNYLFSLQNYIINKLKTLNVLNIEELPFNTFNHPNFFFSHRYSMKKGKDRGLQISTILIKEKK